MNVYIYVLDTLADWEISYLTSEIHSKRYFKNKEIDCSIVTVGKSTNKEITTMGGMKILPDSAIHDISLNPDDILVLPGADTWLDTEQNEILGIVKNALVNGNKIAAICGGTIGLARFGLLNDVTHTSNSKYFLTEYIPEYTGESFYVEQPAVSNSNLITASGLSPVEFTYEIMKTLGVWRTETLEAWKNLYNIKSGQYYYELMNSLQ